MTAPGRHASDDGSLTRSGGGALVRGAVLIVLAVILGSVLLSKGIQDGSVLDIGGKPGDQASGAETTTTTIAPGETTTTTLPPPRPPNEVKVLVLNGSGKSGVAARATEQLQAVNYNALSPENAPAGVPTTTVYYVEGYQSDAQAIAGALGVTTPVAAMPTPPPTADIRGANVVVVLGADTPPAG